MTAKTKKLLTIALTALALAAFVITPLAWFASYWASGSAGFKPGSNPSMPDVVMWMYHSEADIEDDKNDASGQKSEGWYQTSGLTVSDPNVLVPPVAYESTSTLFKYDYKSLHFGKVDNLVDLREDNKVYMRFAFNVEDHGNTVMDIRLSYATSGYTYEKVTDANGEYVKNSVLDSIYLYNLNGTSEANAKFDLKERMQNKGDADHPRYTIEFDEHRPGAMQFMKFQYAISKTRYDSPNDFGSLTFSESIPINCGRADGTCTHTTCNCTKPKDAQNALTCTECTSGRHSECNSCTACDANKCGSIKIENLEQKYSLPKPNDVMEDADVYYLYIELTPLLDAFGMQENILDYFVPSYMLFDVKFDIEIG